MYSHASSWVNRVLAVLVVSLAVLGCDASLQPFAEETGLYSIYGYLTLSDQPHDIRIKNLNKTVGGDSNKVLDATVTLTNLETGDTEVLADSVVTFNGVTRHNFRSQMKTQLEEMYELSVERSDGRQSTVTATMPPLTVTELTPRTDAQCNAPLRVEFPNVDDPRFIRAQVGMKYAGQLSWLDLEFSKAYTSGLKRDFKPASYVDELVPRNVTPFVDCDAERYCNLLDDKKIRIAYTHFGPDWPPDSVLTDPLQSEVTNGTGVFGGLRRDTLIASTDADLRCPGSAAVPCRPVPAPCTRPPCSCPDV